MTITLFLADDHDIVRHGLRTLLDEQPNFKVIGEANNGRMAIEQISLLDPKPDIVILDIAMPELNGIDALHKIHKEYPAIQAIILSMHATSEHVFRALKAGARGYLLKESVVNEIVEAIQKIYGGQLYLSQAISDTVVADYISYRELSQRDMPLMRLTNREREILQLVVEGKSSTEIATLLFISSRTVDTHRSRIMQKLDINDLPGLVKFAIQHGLTSV